MKLVLITGASQGLGAEIAQQLSSNNYHCLLLSRNEAKLKKLSASLPSSSDYILCDLKDPSSIELALKEVKSYVKEHSQSQLYGLINNAGIFQTNKFEEEPQESLDDQIQVNLKAPLQLTRSLFPELKASSRSHIINIASTAGVRPVPGCASYVASKAGLILATQNLALEWGPYNIQANVISPGIINTPIHEFYHQTPKELAKTSQEIFKLQALKKLGEPKDVASMVKFLLSEENELITGANFIVDGGISLV